MTEATLEKLGIDMTPKEPDARWIKQKFIITGSPKIGKTTFWAQGGEKTWFFRMAPEFNDLTTWGVDCKDFKDVEGALTKLFKAKNAGLFKWETIVFDPGVRLLEYIAEDICIRNEVDSIGEIGHGKGWSDYKKGIKAFMRELENLPCAVVLNIHSFPAEYPEVGNEKKKFTKEVVALSGKTETPIVQWADHILHIKCGYLGNIYARTMITRGNKHIEAGTKSERLRVHPQINWGEKDKENYDKFRALFD